MEVLMGTPDRLKVKNGEAIPQSAVTEVVEQQIEKKIQMVEPPLPL